MRVTGEGMIRSEFSLKSLSINFWILAVYDAIISGPLYYISSSLFSFFLIVQDTKSRFIDGETRQCMGRFINPKIPRRQEICLGWNYRPQRHRRFQRTATLMKKFLSRWHSPGFTLNDDKVDARTNLMLMKLCRIFKLMDLPWLMIHVISTIKQIFNDPWFDLVKVCHMLYR